MTLVGSKNKPTEHRPLFFYYSVFPVNEESDGAILEKKIV
jgi:hypothetical protein